MLDSDYSFIYCHRDCGNLVGMSYKFTYRIIFLIGWILVGMNTGGPEVVAAQRAHQKIIRYSLTDEVRPNTNIGNIKLDGDLEGRYSASVLNSFLFSITKGNSKGYFRIDKSSGFIWTTDKHLDRDELCPGVPHCELTIDVAILQPSEYLQFFKVVFVFDDNNDNAPIFPNAKMTLQVSESASPGSSFVLPTAQDPDGGRNGIQEYRIAGGHHSFRIRALRNLDGSTDWRLELTKKLNREHQSTMKLQLQAMDGGRPSKSGSMVLEIDVVDANDNSPVFDTALYNISLREDTRTPAVIAILHATDSDAGINGEVVYTLTEQTLREYGTMFSIHNTTGELVLHRPVDYEQEKAYRLLVQARDCGPDSVPVHVTVLLHVIDVNDFKPEITINSLTSDGIEVKENQEAGEFVAHVAVEDLDKGPSGEVRCDIPDSRFRLEEIYPGAYKLLTSTSFDRELHPKLRFSVRCQDNGLPPLTSILTVAVTVLDDNDHSPRFTRRGRYSASIKESVDIGTSVLQVNATDADEGSNAKITYYLSPAVSDLLRIDSHGLITTRNKLDHELRDVIEFKVIAADNGEHRRSSTATVSLTVQDVNDEPPLLSQSSYNFGTRENDAEGTEIGSLTATDRDKAPFNQFTFSLRKNKDAATFQIDRQTGKITTRRILDLERQPAYYFVVMVTDTSPPYLSSTASVTVYVADINDNAPQITFPTVGNDTVEISSFLPSGYKIAHAHATDLDRTKNGKVVYTIGKGNEAGHFQIDPRSGAISISTPLRDTPGVEFELLLQVADQGDEPKTATATLYVLVNHTEAFALLSDISVTSPEDGPVGYHQTILILLGAVTAVLVLILITAIVCIRRRQGRTERDSYKYMCTVDLANMMEHNKLNPSKSASSKFGSKNAVGTVIPDELDMSGLGGTLTRTNLMRYDDPGTPNGYMRPPHSLRSGSISDLSIGSQTALQDDVDGDIPDPKERCIEGCEEPPDITCHAHGQPLIQHADSDSTSGCSADMSNSDSGRGHEPHLAHIQASRLSPCGLEHRSPTNDLNNPGLTPPNIPKLKRKHLKCPLSKCGGPHLPPRSPSASSLTRGKRSATASPSSKRRNDSQSGYRTIATDRRGESPYSNGDLSIWKLKEETGHPDVFYSDRHMSPMTTFGYDAREDHRNRNIPSPPPPPPPPPPDSTYVGMEDVAAGAVDV